MDHSTYSSMANARTAGSTTTQYKTIQAWKTKKIASPAPINSAQQQILSNLDKASQGKVGTFDTDLKTTMAYAGSEQQIENKANNQSSENYKFNDIIDIINPLHHLPIVSTAYRGLTNDKIHPISQIIGGAIYGGPIGAVAGTVNAISQVKTGKDLSGHALSFVGLNKKDSTIVIDKNNPEQQLNNVAHAIETNSPLEKLPGATMAFVNLSEPQKAYQYINIAEGRTAGRMMTKMASYKQINKVKVSEDSQSSTPTMPDLKSLPRKEEITSLTLSAMPPRRPINT